MLPDDPRLKARLASELRAAFEERVNYHLGWLGSTRRSSVREGDRVLTIREDGTHEETELNATSAETSIPTDRLQEMSMNDLIASLDEAAISMARQMKQSAYQVMTAAATSVGNVVSAGGKPFSAEIYLEMLAKIEVRFNSLGEPQIPTTIIGPAHQVRVKNELRRLETDSELSRRYSEIVERKRMEWLAREADRKLAE